MHKLVMHEQISMLLIMPVPSARIQERLSAIYDNSLCVVQNERVLFHYNGHGVPRPTANGEIWVFNKSYTQYIPMSIYDLQAGTISQTVCSTPLN